MKVIIKVLKYLKYALLALLGILVLYLFFAVLLSIIPVNSKLPDKKPSHVIYLASNGVHLDIILPAKDTSTHWFRFFNFDTLLIPYINYLAFGWGDKEFYINTPEWSDLTFHTAFQAVFLKGESAMHVTPLLDIHENNDILKIEVNDKQYFHLIKYIQNSFLKDSSGIVNKFSAEGYGKYDGFYSARRNYNLFYTCNTWVNQAFKESDIRSCIWTPFDKGLFYQIKKLKK